MIRTISSTNFVKALYSKTAAKAGAATKARFVDSLLDADITNDEKVKDLEAVIKRSGEIDSWMGQDSADNVCDAQGDYHMKAARGFTNCEKGAETRNRRAEPRYFSMLIDVQPGSK